MVSVHRIRGTLDVLSAARAAVFWGIEALVGAFFFGK
jgi:hypothetical protein